MEMTKSYDVSVLGAELEKTGIQGGIQTLSQGLATFETWLEKSAELSTDGIIGKLDDVAVKGEKAAIEWLQGKLADIGAKLTAASIPPVVVPTPDPAPPTEGGTPA